MRKIGPRIEASAIELIRANTSLGTDERALLKHIQGGTFPPNMVNFRAKVLYNAILRNIKFSLDLLDSFRVVMGGSIGN